MNRNKLVTCAVINGVDTRGCKYKQTWRKERKKKGGKIQVKGNTFVNR